MKSFKKYAAITVATLALAASASHLQAAQPAGGDRVKQGILLVAFGTTVPEANVALENIDRIARQRFADTEIRWAYTSSIIRRKLARQGKQYDSPLLALARLKEEGFTHVAVQSLHIAAGAQFDELAETVALFRSGSNAFKAIEIGLPLLSLRSDVERVIAAVLEGLPERQTDDAVVLMGHGNKHGDGEMALLAIAAHFQLADPLAFFGTVVGQPALEDVLAKCREKQPKRAFLVPFMTVAGDHARNDLAGDEADSWMSRISALGITCIPVLHGLGENDEVAAIWLDHLATAITALEK